MGYNGPPPPAYHRDQIYVDPLREAELLIDRISSLERVNALRAIGAEWGEAWADHEKRWIVGYMSPPPPPRKPAPPIVIVKA